MNLLVQSTISEEDAAEIEMRDNEYNEHNEQPTKPNFETKTSSLGIETSGNYLTTNGNGAEYRERVKSDTEYSPAPTLSQQQTPTPAGDVSQQSPNAYEKANNDGNMSDGNTNDDNLKASHHQQKSSVLDVAEVENMEDILDGIEDHQQKRSE